MLFGNKQHNVYFASAIIIAGLFFMLVTGVYITGSVSGSSSLEMAIDKRVDDCWKENNL